MSHVGDNNAIVGINWASSSMRAYLIDANGCCRDEFSEGPGVVGLDHAGMARAIDTLIERWPNATSIYACGMIGSPLGWQDVGYVAAPAGRREVAGRLTMSHLASTAVAIVPGISCERDHDSAPDVLRGEEIELLGETPDGIRVLPGAHTKWVQIEGGRVTAFFTTISGEIEQRLTREGLLASVVQDAAGDGPAFRAGVTAGLAEAISLTTSLFGVRARVMCGSLAPADARSYLRGLLIGAEIADAKRIFPALVAGAPTAVRGGALGDLYATALSSIDIHPTRWDARAATVAGFRAMHEARVG